MAPASLRRGGAPPSLRWPVRRSHVKRRAFGSNGALVFPKHIRTFLILISVAAGSSSCLPLPVTYHLAPAIVGSYRGLDTLPVTGARVGIATAYQGFSCSKLASQTTTDSLGRFHFPPTDKHYGYVVLLPITPAPSAYELCLTVAGTLRAVLLGYSASVAKPDSLQCTQFQSPSGLDVRCTGWLEWVPEKHAFVRH